MATSTINYGSDTAITFDVSSLGASSTFLAGRESTQIDNTTNKFVDAVVTCDGILGHASTAPTVGQQILLYLWGSDVSLATTPIDVLDGTDSAETLTNTGVLYSALRLAHSISVIATTSDIVYNVAPFNVADIFGGVMPKFWGLFVSHNCGAALHATDNTNMFSYNGIKFDTA